MSFPARITGKKGTETRRNSVVGSNQIPNAKKPRSRPPTNLRDKLGFLQGHLPPNSGPYSVGSMDMEVPVPHPRTFSHIRRDGVHLLRLETVLFTLYYPAAFGSGAGKDPSGNRKWSRETWLPRPRKELAKGYGKFAGIPDPLAIAWFAGTTMFTKIRAFRNSPLARHWPPEGNSKQSGYKIKNKEGPPPPGHAHEPAFPLLFFSHGLGGTRTAYSSVCCEFASYGFVVCALEHRDGSGPRTFVNHPRQEEPNTDERVDANNIEHHEKERERGFDKVDYIFPKDNPLDTSPLNEKGVDEELRTAQIELRLAEIEEAYQVLCDICSGKGEDVAQKNLRREGYVGATSRGLDGVDWSAWKERFHCERVTVAGHSFGAATVVEILRNADRFKQVQAGIIYDIWGAPIKPPREDPRHRIHAPLLGINSEAFMYWQSNFDAVMSLMKEAKEQGAPAYLCTVRGSIHISQSDFSLLYPHVCSFFLKSTVNPQRAIDLNISASLEFLKEVTEGAGKSIIERCLTDEHMLSVDILDELPDDHRPEDEWIAARLKIPHEFRTRFVSRLQRKMKRRRAGNEYNAGDEIWMHFKPEEGEVVGWRGKEASERGQKSSDEEESSIEPEEEPQESYLGCPPSWRSSES
ncbi:platelet-activating factor acetylhydrolase, isoform II-domain-containing protein [Clohesyomyces aquaticus]|uniref:Putative phospholipase n=1 Tax=Clohesyomyces aquaticus TaxID=1231657 RepID=A0A1Y2A2D8_9PLEO|nr:platelet-activating factor acetylhydrolase, isoform II-domain-containing protein [Clohesyomyces aquaticus]